MERVVTFGGGPFRDRERVHALTERIGRGTSDRDAAALVAWLETARDRYPIGTVRRHACRHDEGIMDCSGAVIES